MNSLWDYSNVKTRYPEPQVLAEPKVCTTCDKLHFKTTPNAIICVDGYLWFHCDTKDCGSTLTLKLSGVGA